jgi:capsular exopolysaccharide synthesis family protein
MSKIYEALQNVHREKKGGGTFMAASMPVPLPIEGAAGLAMEDEMLGLHKVIETLLPHQKSRVIQFIGARQGEGTSTVVREFARVSSHLIGHSVLLLDADRHDPGQMNFFEMQEKLGWLSVLRNGGPSSDGFHQVGQSKLFLSPGSNSSVSTPEIFNSKFEHFCEELREEFDLVVIDSAPLVLSADGLAIATKVDGVILVVEAEKTKWQAVKTMRDSISRVGGNILGVVLNKRRYYIPESIYKHL